MEVLLQSVDGAFRQRARESYNGLLRMLPCQLRHNKFLAFLGIATQSQMTYVSFKRGAP